MSFVHLHMKWFLALTLLMLLVRPANVLAENEFVISSASTRLDGSVYFLDARFEINLPGYIASAFEKGFDLPISMEVEVVRHRDYWFNEAVVTIRQQYLLQYHAILDSVTLLNVSAGSRRHFSSLKDALSFLTVLENYPLLDNHSLKQDEQYHAILQFGIDLAELPIPLKSSSWWENDWDLVSEPREWIINP
jgi:hypothetical protein